MIVSDQIGNKIELKRKPKRIVSLVPSLTETIFDLGMGEYLVGATRFCVEPKGLVEKVPKVGGTKKINIEFILDLQPDIVIANKEENDKEQVENLQKFVPVWVSNVIAIEDSFDLIQKLGEIFGKFETAKDILEKIKTKIEVFSKQIRDSAYFSKKVLYFIWKKPYMVVGKDTFINSMLNLCSLNNLGTTIFSNSRYPVVAKDELTQLTPDLVYLSTEPYPFSEKHLTEFKELFPNSEIRVVRGDYFSWYGSRILKAIDYFGELFELDCHRY
ncbi:MAG: ABC transporter substrate-binding protein [Candidatus Kapaibacteriota bacterium]